MRVAFEFVEILVILTIFIYVVKLIWKDRSKEEKTKEEETKK